MDTEWAGNVDWEFWRDSARTLEEQHATTAREHTPVTPEEFAKRIGESRFAPLMRNQLEMFARFSTVIRKRGLPIRTEKSHISWCCLPGSLGAAEVGTFLAAQPLGDGVDHFFRGTVHRHGFPACFSGASIQSRCPSAGGEYS